MFFFPIFGNLGVKPVNYLPVRATSKSFLDSMTCVPHSIAYALHPTVLKPVLIFNHPGPKAQERFKTEPKCPVRWSPVTGTVWVSAIHDSALFGSWQLHLDEPCIILTCEEKLEVLMEEELARS